MDAINEHYFDARRRTEKQKRALYYILGAWYAAGSCTESTYKKVDGSIITRKGVKFESREEKLVQIVQKALGDKHKTQSAKDGNSYWFEDYRTPTLCDRLDELGAAVPKEKREFPEIPKKYISHFVRGFFDARASISIRDTRMAVEIRFNSKFLKVLRNVLKTYAHVEGGGKKEDKLFYGLPDAAKIYDFIYQEEGLYLPFKKRRLKIAHTRLQYVRKYTKQLQKRVEKAKRVLEKGGTNAEAASAAEYAHETGLYIPFRKVTGVTPLQYKRMHLDKMST